MVDSSQPRFAFTGLVHAPVPQVWEGLLAVSPLLEHVDRSMLAQGPDQQHLTTTFGDPPISRISVEIDRQGHWLATQGEWWYRGVHSVTPHEHGSLLLYRVYNIAPGMSRWLVPLATRNYHPLLQKSFQDLLHQLGDHLHCPIEFQD
jgi:hypothetical protein